MNLIYTDESGINYSLKNDCFIDGPFIIYGGICVDECKYFHLERLFLNVIEEYFNIEDWHKQEIHATAIWNREGNFKNYELSTIRNFFDETLQLITKLNITTLVGYYRKTETVDSEQKRKEISYAIYSFFHLVEYHLSQNNTTGIIISDKQSSKTDCGDDIFSKIFYDRSSWRTNPKSIASPLLTSRFKYESRSCFILDNIHYVDSRYSIFNQITDIVVYIIMRVLTYKKFEIERTQEALLDKVPITSDTFKYYFLNSVKLTHYEVDIQDVNYYFPSEMDYQREDLFINDNSFRVLFGSR